MIDFRPPWNERPIQTASFSSSAGHTRRAQLASERERVQAQLQRLDECRHLRRSYSGLVMLALLLVLIFGFCNAWSSEPKIPKAGSGAQQPQAEQRRAEKAPLVVIDEITTKKDKAEAENDAKERDEKSHLDAALVKYTRWLAIGTFALFLAAAIQVGLFVWQLRLIRAGSRDAKTAADAAHASVRLARDEFNASHRPWVRCEVALAIADATSHPSAVRFDQSGMYLTLKFTMKNVGSVPALNAMPELKIVLEGHTRDFLTNTQMAICSEIKTRERGRYAAGLTIFPDDTVEIVVTASPIARPEIEAELANNIVKSRTQTITVNAIGCIDYRSAIDLSHHQTGFSYYVCATQADGGSMKLSGPLLPIQETPIPMIRIFWVRVPLPWLLSGGK